MKQYMQFIDDGENKSSGQTWLIRSESKRVIENTFYSTQFISRPWFNQFTCETTGLEGVNSLQSTSDIWCLGKHHINHVECF